MYNILLSHIKYYNIYLNYINAKLLNMYLI